MSFSEAFGLKPKDTIAVIGSGGKTTLCYKLSCENEDKKVIFSTTTKIFPATKDSMGVEKFYDFYGKTLPNTLENGVSVFGNFFKSNKLKISSLNPKELAKLKNMSDIFIYEADGAKCKPLKAWSEYEPVILEFSTVVIGVIPLHVYKKRAKEEIIHRFDTFCEKFNLFPNETIGKELFVKIIKEMFQKAPKNARKILFFNRFKKKRDLLVKEISREFADIEFFAGSLKRGEIGKVT